MNDSTLGKVCVEFHCVNLLGSAANENYDTAVLLSTCRMADYQA